ncbi:MAG: hypothetical protein MJE77_37090 [Proteobacteria bacterium]|nr:hypothetical protein [Pseudomonadota bacterium]
MTADAQPAPANSLPARTVLADRYAIKAYVRSTSFTEVYSALDRQTDRAVFVHALRAELASPASGQVLASAVQAAGKLGHAGIAAPIDAASAPPTDFIVTLPVPGHTASELLARRAETGTVGFGARNASRIVLAAIDALAAAHADGVYHGAISTETVYIDDGGQVTLTGFALAALLVHRAAANSSHTPPCIAAEVAASGRATEGGDVFALGMLLYQLLCGRPLQKGGPRPSEVVADLPSAFDALIASSALPEPRRRPTTAAGFGQALRKAMSAAASRGPTQSRPGMPSLAQSLAPQQSAIDANLLADSEEKWLISKGRLDYGPFSMSEIVAQIEKGEILTGNILIDNHSGERVFVEQHPVLADLVEQARQRRDDSRRADAEAAYARREKRRGTTLYAVIAGGVAALGLVVYLIVGAAGDDDSELAQQSIDVVSQGEFRAAIRFPEKAARKTRPQAGKKTRRSQRSDRSSDTLALDLSEEGGNERLDNSVINSVVQRHGRRLGRCLHKNSSRRAKIDFIIHGPTGRVNWVKVNGQQNGALHGCIDRALRGMKFPAVDGPRTRAEFEMEL